MLGTPPVHPATRVGFGQKCGAFAYVIAHRQRPASNGGCNVSVCFTLLAALRIESSHLFCSVNDCPIFCHVVLTVWHGGTLGKTKPG